MAHLRARRVSHVTPIPPNLLMLLRHHGTLSQLPLLSCWGAVAGHGWRRVRSNHVHNKAAAIILSSGAALLPKYKNEYRIECSRGAGQAVAAE